MINDSFVISAAIWGLAVLSAYLVGAIPFGYMVAYRVKGIDIRTVGSGNVGATNVGRTLGFRYFLLVFVLDLLKGFLPTWGFPYLVEQFGGSRQPDLPVVVALAAILGHTFPVYLRFQGGKGVATSVGAVLALDPISCAASVVAFGAVLALTRFVSLASLLGGVAFATSHFARQAAPFNREHIAMSVFSITVLALLVVRHRGNVARIWAGTEHKVSFRGRGGKQGTEAQSSGKVLLLTLVAIAAFVLAVIGGIQVYDRATQPIEVSAGPWTLREIDRVMTGQQRVDGIAFAKEGSRLAAACPRYDRIVIYRVEPQGTLAQIREIQLEGRPVALATLADLFIVLETPTGDQRHVEPGWWETFDSDGNRAGGRHVAGYYPDDLVVSPNGKHLLILSSGQAEGDQIKPLPALEIVDFDRAADASHLVGRVTFDKTDDPCRLALSASGRCAAVLLTRTNHTLALDVSNPRSPLVIGRSKSTGSDSPYVSYSPGADWIMMPVASQSEGIAIRAPESVPSLDGETEASPIHHVDYLVCTRQRDSVLELFQTEPTQSLGRLPLTGPLNLGRTRPTGLAYSRERALLAVATRSGTIHMVRMIPRRKPMQPEPEAIAASRTDRPRR